MQLLQHLENGEKKWPYKSVFVSTIKAEADVIETNNFYVRKLL